MRIPSLVAVAVLACALASPAAFAADDGNKLPLDPVRSQQAEIRAGVQAGTGIYKNLSMRDRSELLERQEKMLRMIEGKKISGELSEAEKVELFNTLEWIEATANREDDERMVCERRKVLGSNRTQRFCMTVAQRREAQERARNDLDLVDRQMRQ